MAAACLQGRKEEHLNVSEEQIPWYVLMVRRRWETSVSEALAGKGYRHLMPTYIVRRRKSNRWIEHPTPLFPGYVFCQLNPDATAKVITTPGVINFVKFGGKPVPVDEDEMRNLLAMVVSGVEVHPWPLPAPGSRVRVERGPLYGLEGILVGERPNQRVVVTVSILQRSVAAEVHKYWIRPLDLERKGSEYADQLAGGIRIAAGQDAANGLRQAGSSRVQ